MCVGGSNRRLEKLHNRWNQELCDSNSSELVLVYEFREGEMMGRTCSTYGGEYKCLQYFNGEVEDKRPHGRHFCSFEDNINVYLKEVDGMVGT